MWQIRLLLTLLSSLSECESLVATTEWQDVESDSRISVPVIPYSFQVETESIITQPDDDFTIRLGEMVEGGSTTDKIDLHIDVIGNKFTPTPMLITCPDALSEMNTLVIATSGTDNGIWTFKVWNTYIEFFLNGELVISYDDNCLMDEVRNTNVITFGNKDDISKRFRLQLDPCTAYPSDWNHVKPLSTSEEIDAGSKVTVQCEDTRVSKGSSEVTCTSGDQWQFEEKPDCVLQCTGFDGTALPNMFIPSLPAYEGAESEVTCFAGTFQLGGDHVICVSGKEFRYVKKPDCREIGSYNIKTIRVTSHDERRANLTRT